MFVKLTDRGGDPMYVNMADVMVVCWEATMDNHTSLLLREVAVPGAHTGVVEVKERPVDVMRAAELAELRGGRYGA